MTVLCATAPIVHAQTPAAPASDVTITARRIMKALRIDGRFDDDMYQELSPFTEFIQQDPREGEPASERTELWVAFDDENIYFAVKCYHSDPDRIIATELRRDSGLIFQNDSVSIVIDTFHDLRNGFKFQTNALGAVQESMVVDEVNVDSWNTIWEVRSARYDWGWGLEMGIPFKSIRYPGSGPQVWGINLRRNIKANNELAYLTPMPRSFGANAIYHMGSAATLVGMETPAQSMNLEIKPYAVSSLTTDRAAATSVQQQEGRQRRVRLQVRADARPDSRHDLSHRFRPGGRRPAAGQPDALQPVLSREARLLPGGPGDLCLRRRRTSARTRTPAKCRCSSSAGASG